ncbi:hypothetical protein Hanom_Chr01g00048271 [Helianthus anomalus]
MEISSCSGRGQSTDGVFVVDRSGSLSIGGYRGRRRKYEIRNESEDFTSESESGRKQSDL